MSSRASSVVGAVVGAIILILLLGLIKAWAVMVLLGVLASQTGWPIAIGFAPTYVLCVIVGLMMADASSSSS